jgi:hypothetical protein
MEGSSVGAPPAQRDERLALSFTGGKDCVLAAHVAAGHAHPLLPRLPDIWGAPPGAHVQPATAPGAPAAAVQSTPVSLLVVFAPAPAPGERPGGGFRAHPIAVIEAQAEALGLPLVVSEVGGAALFPAVDCVHALGGKRAASGVRATGP